MPSLYNSLLYIHIASGSLALLTGTINMIRQKGGAKHRIMAYDEFLAERISNYFTEKHLNFYEKNMMGGRVFMLNDKMCCGIHYDKKRNCDLLMAHVGSAVAEKLMKRKGCHPMDFTGRPMKGYFSVDPNGFDLDKDLVFWLDHCITFNPKATMAKKRKKNESTPYPIQFNQPANLYFKFKTHR